MNDAEYIKRLEDELSLLHGTIEQQRREMAAAKETIKATVTRAELAEQRAELMRQIACAITASTNKIQRIAAGEKE